MPAPLLEITGLEVRYGGAVALTGVSMRIEEGAFISVVGANGAGKTTLIHAIAGIVPAIAGSIRYRGTEIRGRSNAEICELGIAQVPEGRQIFPSLSVSENLWIGGALRRARRKRADSLARVYQLFPRLAERRRQSAGTLSGGEQQMLAIGRCMMADPELMMLDEPSLGLSPLLTQTMFKVIADLHRGGLTLLLVEQNVADSLALCDRAYVLENGATMLDGSGAELLADPRVKQAYLGL